MRQLDCTDLLQTKAMPSPNLTLVCVTKEEKEWPEMSMKQLDCTDWLQTKEMPMPSATLVSVIKQEKE